MTVVDVELPSETVDLIDRLAARKGISRSEMLTELVSIGLREQLRFRAPTAPAEADAEAGARDDAHPHGGAGSPTADRPPAGPGPLAGGRKGAVPHRR
jgi:predicted transcriptional regulator